MLNSQYLDSRISALHAQSSDLRWLINHGIRAERVAHFGCHIGGQTLALMSVTGANEAIGLDIDEESIRQARDTLRDTQENVRIILRNSQFLQDRLTEEDRNWLRSLPVFFRDRILQSDFSVNYVVQDITRPTSLETNHYDLVFCDMVLNHIWYDENRQDPEQDAQVAVSDMARVVTVGGIVAVRELIQSNNRPRLEFQRLFDNVGLVEWRDSREVEGRVGSVRVAEYLYSKPGQKF